MYADESDKNDIFTFEVEPSLLILARLWRLADRFLMTDLQNYVSNTMHIEYYYIDLEDDSGFWADVFEAVNAVYADETLKADPIKEFLIGMVASPARNQFQSGWQEMLQGLPIAFAWDVVAKLKEGMDITDEEVNFDYFAWADEWLEKSQVQRK